MHIAFKRIFSIIYQGNLCVRPIVKCSNDTTIRCFVLLLLEHIAQHLSSGTLFYSSKEIAIWTYYVAIYCSHN